MMQSEYTKELNKVVGLAMGRVGSLKSVLHVCGVGRRRMNRAQKGICGVLSVAEEQALLLLACCPADAFEVARVADMVAERVACRAGGNFMAMLAVWCGGMVGERVTAASLDDDTVAILSRSGAESWPEVME